MSKGTETKEAILQQAAQLFNRRGFFGAALSDVMDVTGLEKGGIYNHFKSKEDLALQAFDYAIGLLRTEIGAAVAGKRDAIERLEGLIGFFNRQAEGYPLPGGCPVMNTAIEADDALPELRERARQAMDEWHEFIGRIVRRGQEKGQIDPAADPLAVSTILISTMEGAIMQSKLYGNLEPVQRASAHLRGYLHNELRRP
jgi:TetR/AcrR family transcriptional repressor of nem operon